MKSRGSYVLLSVGCLSAGALALTRGGFGAWFLWVTAAVLLLYAAVLPLLALQSLSAEQRLAYPACRAGDPMPLTLQLSYRGWLPLLWLVVQACWLHESSGQLVRYRKLLFPGFRRSVTLHYRLTGLWRGHYRLQAVEAATGDLFGFAVKVHKVELSLGFVVYPRPSALNRPVLQLQPLDDGVPLATAPWPSGPSSDGVRPYAAGDAFRRIHWRATARLNRLMVKEAEHTAGVKRMLLLDAGPAAAPAEAAGRSAAGEAESMRALLEKRVALAAGLLEAAAGSRASCGFACSSAHPRRIPPAIRPDLTLAYDALASVGGSAAAPFADRVREEAAALPPDTSMLILTSTLDNLLLRALAEARSRRRDVHVVYVHGRSTLPLDEREGAAQLQALGCGFTEVPHPRSEWPQPGGVADATA